MPINKKYLEDFVEEEVYHIYNRTNNNEHLFLSDENRFFFLKKYKEILAPFIDTYCWCLLPNHFHLLVKVKSESNIISYLTTKPVLSITERKFLEERVGNLLKVANPKVSFSELIEHTFKRFFQSYALAFNKMYNRKGNLFYKPFKRVKINEDSQFTMAIVYIHANPAKHKLVKDFTKYRWSSWATIISNQPTAVLRNEIIEWFGNLENCIRTHEELAEYYYNSEVAMED